MLPSVDVGKLSEPLTKFIDVVSQGVGKIYQPVGTILEAKASAKAAIILTEAEIQQQELLKRAAVRLTHVEVERQRNIESVIEKAQLSLPDTVNKDPVDKDWTNHFFSSVGDISSDELQSIWARILAGEVTKPGSYSRRLIEALKTISKEEAEHFTKLLSLTFEPEEGWRYLVPDRPVLERLKLIGVHSGWLSHFADIGLLGTGGMFGVSKAEGLRFKFAGNSYVFHGPAKPSSKFIGLEQIMSLQSLTSIGQQIATVSKFSQLEHSDVIHELDVELKRIGVSISAV